MHHKALLFNDPTTATAILQASTPRKAKSLGRRVTGFDPAVWTAERCRVARDANRRKFSSDALRPRLLGTGRAELVEASPFDRDWGIGFAAAEAGGKRERWGMNLLGKVLMEVRGELEMEEGGGERGEGGPQGGRLEEEPPSI
ncbi:hypothetical protein QBC33DRAFT_604085 [Phialemonium atrogriseum]|uniref:NADAR domain-containing protein n=1 Tax=Phialemonium atrogriseum TaxID=1093897 RepID=A0AAJ0FIA0_9PEZI|nr:uncharacterized protein QBC33DRAFT_604085 [Phialemonium atrogriseum]KAK1769406.1 hypothetical protein QBC33DRAFT_604085 [Phialemonium atrogriseum]